jgi:hypothetical protein
MSTLRRYWYVVAALAVVGYLVYRRRKEDERNELLAAGQAADGIGAGLSAAVVHTR